MNTASPSRGWRRTRLAAAVFIVLAATVAVFYAEENWRGKRAWDQCRRELEAKGEVLDWNKLVPPPVPDDQNVFKAPKIAQWLAKAPAESLHSELRERLSSTNNMAVITNKEDALAYLAWSDQHRVEFETIRKALKRPQVRIDCDYSDPNTIAIPNFVASRELAHVLVQRAHCHLLVGKSAAAVDDLTLLYNSRRFLDGRPLTLVAAMINVAITRLYLDVVSGGIQQSSWTDADRAVLEAQLAHIELPPLVTEALRMERAATTTTWDRNRRAFLRVLGYHGWENSTRSQKLFYDFAPQGWFDQNLVVFTGYMNQGIEASDPISQPFSPAPVDKAVRDTTEMNQKHFKPFIMLSSMAIPNHSKACQTALRAQTRVNQARIALALDRYRVARGAYPETLDALAPQFIEKIPLDIIGGQPLKYRRTADGGGLLYSVGWNETDDGGVPGKAVALGKTATDGDWVWQGEAGGK